MTLKNAALDADDVFLCTSIHFAVVSYLKAINSYYNLAALTPVFVLQRNPAEEELLYGKLLSSIFSNYMTCITAA